MHRLSLVCLLALTTLVPAAHAQSPVPGAPAGWVQEDIGAPSVPGLVNLTGTGPSALWVVVGSGTDIQGTADQFHYAFNLLLGDGGITARLLSQVPGDPAWTKTGVMLRETDGAGSRMATLNFTPLHHLEVGWRTDTNGNWSGGSGAGRDSLAGGPIWLRVQHQGTEFQALFSDDGTNWTLSDHKTIAMDLTQPILAGLAVTSHQNGVYAAAGFDNVSVDNNIIMPAAAPTPAPTGPTDADLRKLEDQVFVLVNQARAAAGLPPYNRSPELDAAARRHSLDQAAHCSGPTHTGSDGSSPFDRMIAAGYTNWSFLGENAAAGQWLPIFDEESRNVMDQWMNEQPDAAGNRPHRDNILRPGTKDIGIAVAFNENCVVNGCPTCGRYYWTQDFGAR
jgi:uncharacterized protein YkwD